MRIPHSPRFMLGAALLVPAVAGAQTAATLPAGDNLVVDGVPAMPASPAAEVRRYTEARSAARVDWHPTRRELLISTRFGNPAQLHRVAMPGGDRSQLTFFDEPVGGARYEPR